MITASSTTPTTTTMMMMIITVRCPFEFGDAAPVAVGELLGATDDPDVLDCVVGETVAGVVEIVGVFTVAIGVDGLKITPAMVSGGGFVGPGAGVPGVFVVVLVGDREDVGDGDEDGDGDGDGKGDGDGVGAGADDIVGELVGGAVGVGGNGFELLP